MSDASGKKLCELKVADLKEQLEKRELETTGSKAALSERLEKALKEEGKDPITYVFEKDPPKQIVVKEEPIDDAGYEEKTHDELEAPVDDGDDDDVIIDEVGEVDEEENVAEEKRTEKELRDRTSNIRKDLYRLSKFQKASMKANCVGHIPPLKQPSASFEFSDVVKKYAVSLQVKLEGILPTDSDMIYETPSTPENFQPFNSLDNEVIYPAISTVATTASLHDEMATSSTSPTPPLSLPFSTSQKFATQSQRRRRRKRNTEDVLHLNWNSSAVSSNIEVLGKKSKLLVEENKRRNEENEWRKEWHTICMKIKNEELAIKKTQSEFWSTILNKVKCNPTSISDIANLAKLMETTNPISYDISYPSGPFSAPQQQVPTNNFTPNMDISNVDFEYFAQSKQENHFKQRTENVGNVKTEDI